jgi:hypothetical protein
LTAKFSLNNGQTHQRSLANYATVSRWSFQLKSLFGGVALKRATTDEIGRRQTMTKPDAMQSRPLQNQHGQTGGQCGLNPAPTGSIRRMRRRPSFLPEWREPVRACTVALVIWVIWAQSFDAAERFIGLATAWTTYFRSKPLPEVIKDAKGLNEVSIFAYDFTPDGTLRPGVSSQDGATMDASLKEFKKLRKAARPRLLITIVNDVVIPGGKNRLKNPAIVHQVIGSPSARRKHIQSLLKIARAADGLEIDYEGVAYSDRKAFTQFVGGLASALHRRGKKLYVIAEPKTRNVREDGAGAMDYAALARYADRLVILAYSSHSGSAEPGAPADWAARIARYAMNAGVPKSKLGIAFSLRGEDLEGLSDKVEKLRKGLGLRIFSFWNLDAGNQRIWEWIAQKTLRQKRRAT